MSVAWVGVGVAAAGAYASSQSAKGAADSQAASANAANGLTQDQYNQTRLDNRPFLQNGTAANNLLASYLGIDAPNKTYDQLMAELGPNYYDYGRYSGKKYNHPEWATPEVNNILEQQKQQQAQQDQMKQSGQFGSLLKSFDANDLANDAIYQSTFQNALDQGNQGINRQAAATGSMLSGATLKALSRFGANTAATYGNDAYNRYNTNQSNIYNRLAGISGSGQTAVNNVSSAGQNASTQMGNNLIGVGNARGASSIAATNGYNNALTQGVNGYQSQQLINGLNNQGTGYQYIPSSSYYANNDLLAP
jgi:hypothetical protein